MSEANRRVGAIAAGVALWCLLYAGQALGSPAVADAAAKRPGKGNLVVWATTGGGRELGRPHGAQVQVRWRGRTIGRGRTGARGIAVVRLRRTPRRFSVRVIGGRLRGGHRFRRVRGALRTRVNGYSGQTVYVNPATTLAFYYKAQHPRLSERRVRNRVRAFLRLPRGHGIGAGLRSTVYFDGRRYMARARRAGGLDRYSRRLARTIGRRKGKGISFATRRRGGGRDGGGRGGARISVVEAESLGALAELSSKLGAYQGLFGAIGGVSGALGIVNTVMALSGTSPLDAKVEELGEKMDELLADMHYVSTQLSKLDSEVAAARREGASGTYAELKGDQDELMGEIEVLSASWEAIANLGSQISCPNGTENCPQAKTVKEVCEADPGEPIAAQCESVEDLYLGSTGLVEKLKAHGLTDFSQAHSLARAIGDDGLIEWASREGVLGVRYFKQAESREAIEASDYYLAQLSLLVSLIGAYLTSPEQNTPAINLETELKSITEATSPLPAEVPTLLAGTNVIDTDTGLMWQTQIAANTILDGKANGLILPGPYYLDLHSIHGATAWEMAQAGNFHYSNGWIAGDGSLKLPRTLGPRAPSTLGSRIWRPASANELSALIAESSLEALLEAGFASELFTPVKAQALGATVFDAQFVATLPGDGATSDFADGDAGPLYGGLFNLKQSSVKPGIGVVALGELDDMSVNFLMHRTPYHSECWYYAAVDKPQSC